MPGIMLPRSSKRVLKFQFLLITSPNIVTLCGTLFDIL